MKNTILIMLFAIFGIGTAAAQNAKGDFTLAPKIGLNLSTIASDFDYDTRVAFNAGVIGEYYFDDSWSLRTGLVYDSKGAGLDDGITLALNYVTVPLQANWHFGSTRNWYLNFGPQIGFLTSAKAKQNDDEADVDEIISSFDAGLGIGVGYKFDINQTTQFFVDYQAYGGVINVNDIEGGDTELNSSYSLNLGVVFKL